MAEIRQMIGFWIMWFAVSVVIVMIFGWDMDNKSKVRLVFGIQSFIGLLEVGLYLMGV